MYVTLAALAGGEIELEIGITLRDAGSMFQRRGAQWCPPEIGMQNDTGGVDDRAQRSRQRLPDLAFDRRGQIAQRAFELIFIDHARADGATKLEQCEARRFQRDGPPFARGQLLQGIAAHQLVDRWQQTKEVGFGCGAHLGEKWPTKCAFAFHLHANAQQSKDSHSNSTFNSGQTAVKFLDML